MYNNPLAACDIIAIICIIAFIICTPLCIYYSSLSDEKTFKSKATATKQHPTTLLLHIRKVVPVVNIIVLNELNYLNLPCKCKTRPERVMRINTRPLGYYKNNTGGLKSSYD